MSTPLLLLAARGPFAARPYVSSFKQCRRRWSPASLPRTRNVCKPIAGDSTLINKATPVEHVCRLLLSLSVGVALATCGGARHGRVAYAATTEIAIASEAFPAKTQVVASFRDRIMYAIDYFFATRAAGKAIMLLAVCALLTAIGGLMYHYYGDETPDLPESLWTAWTFIADSGAHADQDTFRKRLVAIPITMGGMFFFALLVGLMTDAVSSKVDQLSKGKSRVLEQNHTLVIGWTNKTVPLVRQLATANKARGTKRSIVVLGSADKEEMDSLLHESLPIAERFGTKVVTRSGSPAMFLESLELCSASSARSIVLLSSPASSPMEADAATFQACLLLAGLPGINADIIVELAELDHVAELEALVGTLLPKKLLANKTSGSLERHHKIVPVATGDMAMRIMVKQALEPGIVTVCRELLQFEGCEFHLKHWPELVGKTFGEALFMFEDAVPCGIQKSLPAGKSRTLVSPPMETTIEQGDKLLVVAEDENSYRPGLLRAPSQYTNFNSSRSEPRKPRLQILIVGWKNDLKDVVQLIDSVVSKGSVVTLLSSVPQERRAEEFDQAFSHVNLDHRYGDALSLKVLKELPLEAYDKVILLMEEPGNPAVAGMLIRHVQLRRGRADSTIVAELPSAEKSAAPWLDESVDPDKLEAMLLAHMAEDADVGSVLDQVVGNDKEGSSLMLRSASAYLEQEGEELTFWDLQARASKRGEIIVAVKSGEKWIVNPGNKSVAVSRCGEDELLVIVTSSK